MHARDLAQHATFGSLFDKSVNVRTRVRTHNTFPAGGLEVPRIYLFTFCALGLGIDL